MLDVSHVSIHLPTNNGGSVHAVDNVSFQIQPGKVLVLLGTSGCGKSTLLSAIAGFASATSGTIKIGDTHISAPGPDRGVVFQKDTLLPWLDVQGNVELGLKFQRVSKTERNALSQTLLQQVGLTNFAKSRTFELSGGMRQRVNLARALATNPAALLMDEPFGALDSLTRQQMQELLLQVVSRSNKMVLFITHSIEEALLLGDDVLVMSPRPGKVAARFALPYSQQIRKGLPLVPSIADIKRQQDFTQIKDEIRALLHAGDKELHADEVSHAG